MSQRETSWINRTPVPAILGGNVFVQIKQRFIRKKKLRVSFTVMDCLQNAVADINSASRVTLLQSLNYSRLVRPNSLLAMAADDLMMPVSTILFKWYRECVHAQGQYFQNLL
jgi:hypothetical protein